MLNTIMGSIEMEVPELTRSQARALRWIKLNQPVGFFDDSGPSLAFTKKLVKLGLVEQSKELIPHPTLKSAAVSAFMLTKIGKKALKLAA